MIRLTLYFLLFMSLNAVAQGFDASYRIQQLVISYEGSLHAPKTVHRTKEEARRLAVSALDRIQQGESFDDLVHELSDETAFLKTNGVVGEFDARSLVSEIESALSTVSEGLVCPRVIETAFGFHVLRRLPSFVPMSIRQILISYKNAFRATAPTTRSRDEAKSLAAQLFLALQKGQSFEANAYIYSDDPASAPKAGYIGVVQQSTVFAAFSLGLTALQVGESTVIESPLGFHIVQRLQ